MNTSLHVSMWWGDLTLKGLGLTSITATTGISLQA